MLQAQRLAALVALAVRSERDRLPMSRPLKTEGGIAEGCKFRQEMLYSLDGSPIPCQGDSSYLIELKIELSVT